MGAPPWTKLSNCTIREVRYEQKEYFLTHLWCHFNKIIAFIHKQPLTPIKQELRNRSCRSWRAQKRRTGSRVTYDPKWLGMQLITSSQITSVWCDWTDDNRLMLFFQAPVPPMSKSQAGYRLFKPRYEWNMIRDQVGDSAYNGVSEQNIYKRITAHILSAGVWPKFL